MIEIARRGFIRAAQKRPFESDAVSVDLGSFRPLAARGANVRFGWPVGD